MLKPSCFLSCSFREEDQDLVAFFQHLLEEQFEVLTAQPEISTDLYDKIFPKLRSSKVFVGIFSKRGTEAIPPDVLIEAGFALAHQKRILGFLETGIDERQQGLLRSLNMRNYPRFNRNKLEAARTTFQDYIQAAARELQTVIQNPFECTYVTKEVTIYSNGYGVIRNQYAIDFNKNVTTIIIPHGLSGGSSAKRGYHLPPFNQLLQHGPQVRKASNYFIASSIVKANIQSTEMTLRETGRSDEQIKFEVRIEGAFMPSSNLVYEWSCGAPDLFAVNRGELQPGLRVRDLPYVESRLGLPPVITYVAGVTFILRFEKPIHLASEPIFRVYGPGGEVLDEKGATEHVQHSSLYIVYVCRIAIGIPFGKITAQWVPV